MVRCEKCGASAQEDTARFCHRCGTPLAASEVAAGEASLPTGSSPTPLPDDQLDRLGTLERGEAASRADYRRAVDIAVADGVVDGRDRKKLDETRDRVRLSEEEAVAVEEEVLAAVRDEAGLGAEDEEGGLPPLALEINQNRFYMEGKLGALDFRFRSKTSQTLRNVCLAVAGQLIGSPGRGCVLPLPGGSADRDAIQIRPAESGEHVLDLAVTYDLDGQGYVWTGKAILRVLAKTENLQSLVVRIGHDIQAGRNVGYGADLGQHIHEGFASGLIKDVNDLLTQEWPENWVSTRLRLDEEATRRRREGLVTPVRVVPGLAGRRVPMDKGALMSADSQTGRRVLLLGLAQVRMGRRRTGGVNDIVLRVLPRSDSNDPLSLQITDHRPHCILSLRSDGLFLADQDTPNGTLLNGEPIRGEAKVPQDQPSEVDVAKALRLRLIPFCEVDEGAEVDPARYAALGQPDDLWRRAQQLRLRSLMIQRIDNLADEEKYLVVYRWANVGRGAGNELMIPGAGLERTHTRILRLGGQFWLESLVEGERLTADGFEVPRGQAFPLAPGMRMTYGTMGGQFAEFRQFGL